MKKKDNFKSFQSEDVMETCEEMVANEHKNSTTMENEKVFELKMDDYAQDTSFDTITTENIMFLTSN